KEVSLTIVVLLSQSVRTFSDLGECLEQLGFRGIELRDNSDHLVYLVMVNFCILLGAFISYGVVTAMADLATLKSFRSIPYLYDWVQGLGGMVTQSWLANDFSVIDHAGELLLLATGALIYMIAF